MQDKLINNPKLCKLIEIMEEHFERARACQKSSRAIVFSQYRDSVSEIVSILVASEPLIRARHFIGQGKGSKGEGQLKGMKQAEQHEVIRQFRADVYNVLVCTCIGEEGKTPHKAQQQHVFVTFLTPPSTVKFRLGYWRG